MPDTKKCLKCGTLIEGEANFCPSCGSNEFAIVAPVVEQQPQPDVQAPIEQPQYDAQPQFPQQPTYSAPVTSTKKGMQWWQILIIIVVSIAVVAGCVVGGAYLLKDDDSSDRKEKSSSSEKEEEKDDEIIIDVQEETNSYAPSYKYYFDENGVVVGQEPVYDDYDSYDEYDDSSAVQDYIDSISSQLDSIKQQYASQGLDTNVIARGNALVYQYTYQEDVGDVDTVMSYLQSTFENDPSTFSRILSDVQNECPQVESIVYEYYNYDGELIMSYECDE